MSNIMSQSEVGGTQGPPLGSNPTTQMASGSPKLSSVKYKTILPIGKTSGYKETEKVEYNINTDVGYFDGKQSYWNIVVRNTSTWTRGSTGAIIDVSPVPVIFNPNQGGHAIKQRVQLQDLKGLSLEDTEAANLYTGIMNAYGNDSDVFSTLARVEGITGRSNQNQHTNINNVDNQYFLPNSGTNEAGNVAVGGGTSIATTFCLPFNLGLWSAFSGEHMAYPNLDIGGTRLTVYLEEGRRCMTTLTSQFYSEKTAGAGVSYNGIVNKNHRLEATTGTQSDDTHFEISKDECDTALVVDNEPWVLGNCALRRGQWIQLTGGAGSDEAVQIANVYITGDDKIQLELTASVGVTDFTSFKWDPIVPSYELDKVELKVLETVPDAATINNIRRAMSGGVNYNTYQLNKLSSAEQLVNTVLNIPTAITRGLSIMVVPIQISSTAGGSSYGINGQDYRNSYMNPLIDSNFYGSNNYNYQWQVKNILIPNRQVVVNSDIENANDNAIFYLQQTMSFRPMRMVKAIGEGSEIGRTNVGKELLLPFFFPILLAPMGSSYNLLDSDPNLRIENTSQTPTDIHAKLYHIFINHTRRLSVGDMGVEVSL